MSDTTAIPVSSTPYDRPRWAARVDFPSWLPPMFVKELRQGLRARGFIGSFIVFHLVMVIAFCFTLELTAASGLRGAFNSLNGFYWTLLSLVLLLIGPLRAINSLRVEVEQRTLDLLVLTRLSAWRIVLGKWGSLLAQLGLILLTALPYGVVRYFFGSVDLLADLRTIGGLFFGSAVLCAACLWVSTLPKMFRIVLPIVLVLGFQGFGLARALTAAAGGRAPSAIGTLTGTWSQLLFGLVVLALFLLLSARRLAPPAENHSLGARLLALGILVLGLVLGGTGRFVPEHMLGFVLMMLIVAIEFSEDRLPLSAHVPARLRGHAVGRGLMPFLLPGWPSAALFVAAVFAGLGALVLLGRMAVKFDAFRGIWVMVLAWQALVAPALIVSFLPRNSSMRLGSGGYFVIQGLFGIISIVAIGAGLNSLTSSRAVGDAMEWFSHVLPVSSFWIGAATAGKRAFTSGEIAGQVVALGGIIILGWLRSRPYREAFARIRQRGAVNPPPAS